MATPRVQYLSTKVKKPKSTETAIIETNEDIENVNVVERKAIKPNKKPHGTDDGNKQIETSTTLNNCAKTVVTQETQFATAVAGEEKPQRTEVSLTRNKTPEATNFSERISKKNIQKVPDH